MALSDNQSRFVDEYLVDLNATKAYLRAGYKCTESAARRSASKLLTNPDIQRAISEKQQQRAERTQITNDRVLLEIARLAFNDPRKAFDENGALLPIQDWPDEVAAAISSIKVKEIVDANGTVIGETKEVKFWDKGKQIELAGKHLGMFTDNVNHKGAVTLIFDKYDLDA
jgi:phage terminase small subunit